MKSTSHIIILNQGPFIKYVTLFLANFYPPLLPVTLRHTSRDPRKYVTHLRPPIFRRPSTKNPHKSPFYKFCLNCSRGFLSGGFCQVVFCLLRFCLGWFLSIPVLSEYICYIRKLHITLNFMFRMYEKKFISVTSHALYPLPSVTNCHTFSDPLPSRVTYFMDGPSAIVK